MKVRGRFAPSPSGEMHLGNAFTALLAWLQVRSSNGTMVLRIEDLDPQRSRSEYVSLLMQDLRWLGLDWDEGPDISGPFGPYEQSQRRDLYEDTLNWLKIKGLVYPCFCSRSEVQNVVSAPHDTGSGREYPGTCRHLPPALRERYLEEGRRYCLRFRVPDRELRFTDLNFGSQIINLEQEQGDFIVRRSDGVHAYQLAVVVDDALMDITHVVRGADLLWSTPKQIALYEALKRPVPAFVHIPLVYGEDGRRLSKRHQVPGIKTLREQGIKPEQVVGLLGYWAGLLPKPLAILARDLIQEFDLNKLAVQPVRLDSSMKIG